MDGHRTYLDARAIFAELAPDRFPTLRAIAADVGLDPARDLLPVAPAAHYTMGGVAVDVTGRSSLDGLWVAGEAAASGAHGANRLASNSLLEALVFGSRVAASVHESATRAAPTMLSVPADCLAGLGTDDEQIVQHLRSTLWRGSGVERDEAGLRAAAAAIDAHRPAAWVSHRARTIAHVAAEVVRAALARTESRGGHVRLDHPETDPAQAERRTQHPEPARSVGASVVGDTLVLGPRSADLGAASPDRRTDVDRSSLASPVNSGA